MSERTAKLQRYWDRHAATYDAQMARIERRFFGDAREWVCGQARGDVLEVAVGTGRNLGHYPPGVRLVGVDFSREMLALARRRAAALGRTVALGVADAHALPFAAGTFDTVVATFSLCAIADDRRAVAEMVRVLCPGGYLLLADHVAGTAWPTRAVQALIELGSVPAGGEHFRRRPIRHVRAAGLTVERHDRYRLGVVERLAARR
ncbi:class I SAM-dependent methyltransferase [Actinocatenispora rupis]|uniref:Ubiquinone/menaquinone biosynthesis methyltransferase n=1 Tax=Actinocatenispora rupis TaxID=519421 RepID=A0A8J3J6W3_9ACTN|nr:class I SAM-dependent methyltransferase [Actinocatenispora rupis]GID12721.1 ubiquinone/menaquinone biosynthesis methyltransferase [Actinocatenispora rupis]